MTFALAGTPLVSRPRWTSKLDCRVITDCADLASAGPEPYRELASDLRGQALHALVTEDFDVIADICSEAIELLETLGYHYVVPPDGGYELWEV